VVCVEAGWRENSSWSSFWRKRRERFCRYESRRLFFKSRRDRPLAVDGADSGREEDADDNEVDIVSNRVTNSDGSSEFVILVEVGELKESF